MRRWLLPIIVLIGSAGCVVGTILSLRKNDLPSLTSQDSCQDFLKRNFPQPCKDDTACCGVWQMGVCAKGVLKNGTATCELDNGAAPVVFGVAALVLLIVGLVLIRRAFRS
jgi:hypothetical protein